MWSLEAKEYRRCFPMGGKYILQVEGEIPLLWCLQPRRAWSETTVLQLSPLQHREHSVPGRERLGHMRSGISRLHTYTARSIPIAVAANPNWESECQRERGILSEPGSGGGGRPRPGVTVRDFWLFREVVCIASWKVIQCCSSNVQRHFFKKGSWGELVRDPMCSHLPAGKDWGSSLPPLSVAGQIDQKGEHQGDFLDPAQHSWQARGWAEWRV